MKSCGEVVGEGDDFVDRTGRLVEAVVGDPVPGLRVVPGHWNLKPNLTPITELPVRVRQERIDKQGSRLRFV